jgi:hypothetical protein
MGKPQESARKIGTGLAPAEFFGTAQAVTKMTMAMRPFRFSCIGRLDPGDYDRALPRASLLLYDGYAVCPQRRREASKSVA